MEKYATFINEVKRFNTLIKIKNIKEIPSIVRSEGG